jgi:hypothetical protein
MLRARMLALAKTMLAVIALALVFAYAGDWLRIRLQPHATPEAAVFETLTFYIATPLKNGKVEVYYDQPQAEICVRALFPQLGLRPCWYARRQPIHRVGQAADLTARARAGDRPSRA